MTSRIADHKRAPLFTGTGAETPYIGTLPCDDAPDDPGADGGGGGGGDQWESSVMK